jgi:hypothetical protein
MAVTNFIPTIWSARLLTSLSKRHVAGAITNRDYEGDASGDSVKITSITDPTIGTYTGADITTEDIDDATRSLLLDQKKYFSFYLDDVERAQSVNGGALMIEAADRAAYGLANTLDAYVLSQIHANATKVPANEKTITTVAGVYDQLVDLAVALDGADVPEENRWAVVPPPFYGVLLKDSRFVAAGDNAGQATRANGIVGQAAGFTIYKSNNLPNAASGTSSTNKPVLAGTTYATTMAEQVRSVEAFRLEKKFADGVKGLHVYGVKVLRTESVVTADIVLNIS